MKSFKQLNLLLSQAQKRRDAHARVLKDASVKLSKDRQQKVLLQRYNDDYQKGYVDKQNLYNNRESLTNFNLFMTKLQDALTQLTLRIEQQVALVDNCRSTWMESEIRVKQIEKLISNRQSEYQKVIEKQLQKENDACGLTLYLYKNT